MGTGRLDIIRGFCLIDLAVFAFAPWLIKPSTRCLDRPTRLQHFDVAHGLCVADCCLYGDTILIVLHRCQFFTLYFGQQGTICGERWTNGFCVSVYGAIVYFESDVAD